MEVDALWRQRKAGELAMESAMGRVTTSIRVENFGDLMQAQSNTHQKVRCVEIDSALVDTGATLLCLPLSKITALGLMPLEKRRASTASGVVTRQVFGGARLTILERTCTVDVMEVPEDAPVLVGYVALENLDLVPDPKRQQLIPNPAHGGKMTMDLF